MLHENKKALSPFYYKKIFLIENERKTPDGCLTFIFYRKIFLGFLTHSFPMHPFPNP